MTRFGLLLILSTLTRVAAAVTCEPDLFSYRAPVKPIQIVDAAKAQRLIWDLRDQNRLHEANQIRGRLQAKLMGMPIGQPERKFDRFEVYALNEKSKTIFLPGHTGAREYMIYELNEELGAPVRMPITAMNGNGSMQVWLNANRELEPISATEDRELSQALADDGDLGLLLFLAAGADHQDLYAVQDAAGRHHVYNIANGYRFSIKEYTFRSLPKAQRPANAEAITWSLVQFVLRENLRKTKHDWSRALNRAATERLLGLSKHREGPVNASDLRVRICILNNLLLGNDISLCTDRL